MNLRHKANENAIDALDRIGGQLRKRRVMAKLAPEHQPAHTHPDPMEEPEPGHDINTDDGSNVESTLEAKLHEIRKSMLGPEHQKPHTAPDQLNQHGDEEDAEQENAGVDPQQDEKLRRFKSRH